VIDAWLMLPLPALIGSIVGFYSLTALLLVYLCFGRATGAWVQSFKGVVAPFFGAIVVILGILVGFLANDVWDRNRRASGAVRNEAASLTSLHDLVSASGLTNAGIGRAIRAYLCAVVEKEWPSMEDGEASPEAEAAQDQLLRVVSSLEPAPNGGPALDRLLLDMALKVREARGERLTLSADYSENQKWACVLLFALMGQVSLAAVHLDRARPQIAAMVIFTVGIVTVIGLVAAHELPFSPPLVVSPEPLAELLKIVPDN
jgi:hypothetical protein